MVTAKKRQEFRIKLQKRARRRAEKKIEILEEDKGLKEVRYFRGILIRHFKCVGMALKIIYVCVFFPNIAKPWKPIFPKLTNEVIVAQEKIYNLTCNYLQILSLAGAPQNFC